MGSMRDSAERTCAEGSAAVRIWVRQDSDLLLGLPSGQTEYTLLGHVDFKAGRCSFVEPEPIVLDQADAYYAMPEGRWVRQRGIDGRWPTIHPCWSLTAIMAAAPAETQLRPDSISDAELDAQIVSDLTTPELASDWRVKVRCRTDSHGRLASIESHLRRAHNSWDIVAEYSEFGRPVDIQVPDVTSTVSLGNLAHSLRNDSRS
jgi:hypothetical protein